MRAAAKLLQGLEKRTCDFHDFSVNVFVKEVAQLKHIDQTKSLSIAESTEPSSDKSVELHIHIKNLVKQNEGPKD